MKKILYIAIITFLFPINILFAQDTLFYEDFSEGLIPPEWEQKHITASSNVEWEIAEGSGLIGGVPGAAVIGEYNLFFQSWDAGDTTQLIIGPISLEPDFLTELTFWHAQVEAAEDNNEQLQVYYREGEEGELVKMAHYSESTHEDEWVFRVIPPDLLNAGSDLTYLIFEGITGSGLGLCVDAITVVKAEPVHKYLTDVNTEQASTERIGSGTKNNPILRTEFEVSGNTGDFILDDFTVKSLNTDDNDIDENGVKLFLTNSRSFNTLNQISPGGVSFVDGKAEFKNLGVDLPIGHSYVWVTYDIEEDAENFNEVNAYIPENGILANDTLYPSLDHDPDGHRIIYKTIFYDDFEEPEDWNLIGEFEIDEPLGLGGQVENQTGSGGLPGASNAYTGSNVLGTNITTHEGNYEAGLEDSEYQAVTPSIDAYYYKDIKLSYKRWLNIYSGDKVAIDFSIDNGTTWEEVWSRDDAGHMNTSAWTFQSIEMPEIDREDNVLIRYTLGPTQDHYRYSGWNIDDVSLTGNYITKDVGVTSWLYPNDGCGYASEDVAIEIKNFGAEPTPLKIPVGFSLDGGDNWQMDTIYLTDPIDPQSSITYVFEPKADLSQSGKYKDVIASTFLEGDQDDSNDEFHTTIFSIPTFELAYYEDFISDDGLWRAYGDNVSWKWAQPEGSVINNAYSGQHAWVTNEDTPYNSDEKSWVESPCFDFTENDYFVLEFWLNTDTEENVDGVSLQYSLDDGENWSTLEPDDEKVDDFLWNWFNKENITSLETKYGSGKGWDGQSEGWINPRIVIPSGISDNQFVRFSFVFASDQNAGEHEGVAFDMFQLYKAPPDVGVETLLEPESDCELSEGQEITVSVKNYGINSIEAGTLIPVGIDVNELSPVYEDFELTESLDPEETVNYTFETTFDISEVGDHNIVAYTMLPGDTAFYEPGAFNDTLSTVITAYGYPAVDLGNDIYTTEPDTVVLDAGEGFDTYLWQDGSDKHYYEYVSDYSDNYEVTVTNVHGCSTSDQLEVVTYDIELDELVVPENQYVCGLSAEQPVTISLINHGPESFDDGDEFVLVFNFNSSLVSQDTLILSDEWNAGEPKEFTFSSTVNLEETQEYAFEIYMKTLDANPANDTIRSSVEVVGYPQPVIPASIATDQLDTLKLDAGDGFESYSWSTSETSQIIDVTQYGNYSVTVTNWLDCEGEASTEVTPEDGIFDITVNKIIEPVYICKDDESVIPEIEVFNVGEMIFSEGTEIELGYVFNNDIVIEHKVFEDDFMPDDYFTYTFDEHIDEITPDNWSFKAWVFADYDIDNSNDTMFIDDIVRPLPDINLGENIYTMEHDTVVLDAGKGYEDYLWQDDSREHYFNVNKFGMYWVKVTDEYGCQNRDSVLIIEKIKETGIDNILMNKHSIYVYPNPADEYIYVSFDFKNRREVQLYVSTMSGDIISMHEFYSQGYYEHKINTNYYEPGVYFINIKTEGRLKVLKFIKK